MTCDDCEKDFDTSIVHNEYAAINVKRYFIICPHCGKKYVSHYENEETIRLQKQIKEMSVLDPNRPKKQKKLKKVRKKLDRKYKVFI